MKQCENVYENVLCCLTLQHAVMSLPVLLDC